MRGAGRVVFAATLLLIVGFLNIIYGIGALDDANYFVNDTRFVLTNLNTLGWVLIILGIIQLTGGFSLIRGQRLRPRARHHRRQPRRDRGTVLDRRRQPLVVAGDIRALHLRRPRDHRLSARMRRSPASESASAGAWATQAPASPPRLLTWG